MTKRRGRKHTTLTETAKQVVKVLKRIPDIKMIAPGVIDGKNKSHGSRFIKIVYTTPGCELIISGQGVQRVSVHTENSERILPALKADKSLKDFTIKEKVRKPDV